MRKWLVRLLASSGLLLTVLAAPVRAADPAGAPPPTLTRDDAIVNFINARMKEDPLVRDARINVESRAGEVQLVGSVPSLMARRRAVEIARGTEGVSQVN